MPLGALTDPSREPTDAEVAASLGRAASQWRRVIDEIESAHGPLEPRWNHGGARFGWSLRLRDAKRVLAYLIPCERHFLVGVVLGEKAAAAALAGDLREDVRAAIEEAPKHAEGRGLRVPVRTSGDADAVLALVATKLAATDRTASKRRAR